ncbi:hypothetical protein DICVIV_08663 [Dictyocaulus viviparus]|uniref:Uncharacterized protein n=1 Tax=Dictyocaulus viviparus TaxID=29172 RepID=A0A0D8XNH5_DICVI|nr:hypothetical protein DICVIV_08663 [Dictyocaulus viviparus]
MAVDALPTTSLSESDIENAVIAAIIESSTAISRRRGSLRQTRVPNPAIISTTTASLTRSQGDHTMKKSSIRTTSVDTTTSTITTSPSFRIGSKRHHSRNSRNRALFQKALIDVFSGHDQSKSSFTSPNENDIDDIKNNPKLNNIRSEKQRSSTISPNFAISSKSRQTPLSPAISSIVEANDAQTTNSSPTNDHLSIFSTSVPKMSSRFLPDRNLTEIIATTMRITKSLQENIKKSSETDRLTTMIVPPLRNFTIKQLGNHVEFVAHKLSTEEFEEFLTTIAPIIGNKHNPSLAENNSVIDTVVMTSRSTATTVAPNDNTTLQQDFDSAPLVRSITNATTKLQLPEKNFTITNGLNDELRKTAEIGLSTIVETGSLSTITSPALNSPFLLSTKEIGAPGSAPPNDSVVDELNRAENFMEVARRLNIFRNRFTVQKRTRK